MASDALEFLDRKIADAEDLIARQQRLIDRLRDRGQDIRHAEGLLATLLEALQRFRAEREAYRKHGDEPPLH